ncbi:MAG: endonuclease domain-containing protein [Xanthobacteraceae bacterium]|nr:endonuclease domain-containing protein [Xanthobacteraceae bacterium]
MIAPNVKRLRTNMTDAEQKLWRARRSRGTGAKFGRQVPLGPFIVDFVCFEAKLIIEVDGGQHADSQRDAKRDRYFVDRGYRVLRFWNNDVLKNLEGVLIRITEFADPSPGALRAPPSPSRSRMFPTSTTLISAELGYTRVRVGEGQTEPGARS